MIMKTTLLAETSLFASGAATDVTTLAERAEYTRLQRPTTRVSPGRKIMATGAATILACLAFTQAPISAYCQTAYPTPYRFTTIAAISDPHFNPISIAVNATGDVYFSDPTKQVVCRVERSGAVNIIAGQLGACGNSDGKRSQARFCYPRGIAIDAADNIFVADTGNNTIRRITPDGAVTTLAGLAGQAGFVDGTHFYARFDYPVSLAVDRLGNIYVADLYNCAIREVTPHGKVRTIAGQPCTGGSADGCGADASFSFPISIAVDGQNNIYVADLINNAIRKVTSSGIVTTLAGRLSYTGGNIDGVGNAARFRYPSGIALDRAGNTYVADSGNQTIRRITPDGAVTTVAGLAGQSGFVDGIGSAVRFWHPAALALDRLGNLYVTDVNNAAIRKGSADLSTKPALSLKTSGASKTSFSE
jgi:sugar lactone lactonase YvrE